jgi:hypothetical protein
MPVSVTELREQARLLEAELSHQAALSDSLDTRAGVAIGFAGVLAGLLVQVKNPDATLRAAVIVALVSAFIGLLAAFPRRFQTPDPSIVTGWYETLPETDATAFLAGTRLRAIQANTFITESKRLLLAAAVVVLVAAVVMAAVGVK